MSPRWWIVPALAACLACPSPRDASPEAASPAALSAPEAEERIRQADDFGEPIYLEVWAAESPTAKRLEALGLLRTEAGRLALTERCARLEVERDFFQEDYPIFSFPVGRREFVEITAIREVPAAPAARSVEFLYRRAPTALGRQLVEAGTRLDELASGRVLRGRAFLTLHPEGWRLGVLEL